MLPMTRPRRLWRRGRVLSVTTGGSSMLILGQKHNNYDQTVAWGHGPVCFGPNTVHDKTRGNGGLEIPGSTLKPCEYRSQAPPSMGYMMLQSRYNSLWWRSENGVRSAG